MRDALRMPPVSAEGQLEAPAAVRAAGRPASASRPVSAVTARRLVAGAVGVYGVVFAAAAVVRHYAFETARFDLGHMTQVVWNTAHGRFLELTTAGGDPLVRLGAHVDPFLVLLAPLWWVWPSPLMLLVVQALAVATGALPVFWLARKHLGSQRAAVHLALAYLVYPATQWNAFTPESGFHPASFALPLILFAVWYLDEERLAMFCVFALLAATTKEQMPLVVGMLGLWHAVSRRRLVPGAPILLAGLGWTMVNFLVIVPHFQEGSVTPFSDRYQALGGTPLEILRTAATDPGAVVSAVATTHKLVFVLLLVAPLLGIWAFAPALALAAVPELAIDLLSSNPNQSTIFFHYTAGIIPFLLAATVLGLARFRSRVDRLSLYVLAAVASTAILSPLMLAYGNLPQALPSNPIHQAKAHAVALVPGGAPVSASNKLGGHLSERRRIQVFPSVDGAGWVVVDRNDETYSNQRAFHRAIDQIRRSEHWRLVYSSRGILAFRRIAAAG